jgi:hypothetical protein
MDESIITWNIPNWLTVVLMAAVGFAIISLAAQTYNKFAGTPGNA